MTEKGKNKENIDSNKTISNFKKKIKKLEQENQNLKNEIKRNKDKILRCHSDFQNYKKRINKELNHKEEETKKKYLSELIDLYELLKKVYKDKTPKKALKLIISDLEKLFKKEKIIVLDCLGKSFDHNFHHAVSTIEKDECENGTVIEEIQKGYMIEDKLLRTAKVIVSMKEEIKKKR